MLQQKTSSFILDRHANNKREVEGIYLIREFPGTTLPPPPPPPPAFKETLKLLGAQVLSEVTLLSTNHKCTYRIASNCRPGIYFFREILDPVLIRDRRLMQTSIN